MNDIGSILTKDSITTSIDYSNDRLLTSHEDGYIRLWDVRAPQIPTNTYKSHSKLASCVKFNKRSYIFASVFIILKLGFIRYYCKNMGYKINFSHSKHRNSSLKSILSQLEIIEITYRCWSRFKSFNS